MKRDIDPIDLIPVANPVPEPTRLPEGPAILVDEIIAAESPLPRRSRRVLAVAAAAVVVMLLGVVTWASLRDGSSAAPNSVSAAEPPSAESAPEDIEPEPTPRVPFVNGELVRMDLPRTNAVVSDADIAAVVQGDIALGLDLLRATAADENTMVSPYSIATTLSMLYPGARAETAIEIAEVMHLAVDDATLHAVRSHIDQALSSATLKTDDDAPLPFTIRTTNSAWGQGGYPLLDDYLSVLATGYDAGLRLVDFSDPSTAAATINDWVRNATTGRIPDLIPAGAIDVDTRLVLVNAVWLAANWLNQFDPDATKPGAFNLLDDGVVTVPMMHATIRTGYKKTDRFEALRLPYTGDAAMVIALPTQGSPVDLAAGLQPADFDIQWGDKLVDVTMPRFAFDAEMQLDDVLQQLGMRAAFVPPLTGADDEADLTGITPVRELYVKDAFHQTSITVDEHGTEAAAASALVMNRLSRPQPATFTADRPFLFWIEHTTTGELLFIGQVTEPSS